MITNHGKPYHKNYQTKMMNNSFHQVTNKKKNNPKNKKNELPTNTPITPNNTNLPHMTNSQMTNISNKYPSNPTHHPMINSKMTTVKISLILIKTIHNNNPNIQVNYK
jgi:hypothetical protein